MKSVTAENAYQSLQVEGAGVARPAPSGKKEAELKDEGGRMKDE